jgi:hypothetical protein
MINLAVPKIYVTNSMIGDGPGHNRKETASSFDSNLTGSSGIDIESMTSNMSQNVWPLNSSANYQNV